MTPITYAWPSPPRARSPSSPTTRHAPSNIRSTGISIASAISSNAASQSSRNSAASQSASKRPFEIIGRSLPAAIVLWLRQVSTPPRRMTDFASTGGVCRHKNTQKCGIPKRRHKPNDMHAGSRSGLVYGGSRGARLIGTRSSERGPARVKTE